MLIPGIVTSIKAIDNLFDNVALLLPFNGVDEATSTTDLSIQAHTITFNGAAQLDTAQAKFGASSALFSGVLADFLTAPDDASFTLGDGDFTLETHIRFNVLPSTSSERGHCLIGHYKNTNNQRSWFWGFTNTDEMEFLWSPNGTATTVVTTNDLQALSTGVWYHVAMCRDGSTVRLFFEGTELTHGGASIGTTTLHDSTETLRIGNLDSSVGFRRFTNGWLDNIRMTVGVARYTSDFTPPGVEYALGLPVIATDPDFDDVILLLRSEGATNGQITFTDESNSARTLTRNGDTIYNNAQTKFGNAASVLFDGSGNDWIQMPDSPDLGLEDRTVEFCLEAWVYATDDSENNGIMVGRDGANSEEYSFYTTAGGAGIIGLNFVLWNPNVILSAPGTMTINTWHHVAVTRTENGGDGDLVLYVDGVSVATLTQDADTATNTGVYYIGHNAFNSDRDFTGHIDSLRFTRNNPRYTGNFTPGAFPIPFDPDFASVSLLLDFAGVDEATTAADASNNVHAITFNDNAQIDTFRWKFGGSSVLLDGSGDFLSALDDATFELGAGEWTIELHVRFNGDPGTADMAFVTKWEGVGGNSWFFGLRNNAIVGFHTINGTSAVANLSEAWNPVGDTWYHIAITRDNSATDTLRVFVDGIQLGSGNTTVNGATFFNGTSDVQIGAFHVVSGPPFDYFNGWIDNVRVTNGVARYTNNFAPPLAPYPIS